jgi:hypothetical protein
MPLPSDKIPTLREIVGAAVAQGCKYGELQGELVGPRGRIKVRYLASRAGVIYPLGNREDDERLDPTTFLSMIRILGILGYDDLIAEIEKGYLLR